MDNKMLRIALVTDDDVIFSPYMINAIILKFKDLGVITNVVILNKIHNLSSKQKQQSIDLYGRFNNALISLYTKIRLSANKYDKNAYSLENVLNKHSIPFKYFEDINNSDTINYLKQYDLDLVLVMSHQILKSEILSLPRLGCINRHPGKLPDYAGMLPVFWAMLLSRQNSNQHGKCDKISVYQTIHIMVEKIDAGKILYEKEYILPDNVTLIGAYAEVFKDTANCYYQGIKNLLDNKVIEQDNSKRVYRTHPNAAECKEFKKYFKILKVKELFNNFGYKI